MAKRATATAEHPAAAALRDRLGAPAAASFQLMGEDLWLVGGTEMEAIGAEYGRALADAVPAELRDAYAQEQAAILEEAHHWLRRYNLSIHRRIQGYLELGRRCGYEYPWPAVAILGICQVLSGESQTFFYSLVGQALARVGVGALEEMTDGTKDVLRRTNRGIFADSVPTVLYALRCHDLRRSGQTALAEALVEGPLPPLMDDESRLLVQRLYRATALDHGAERFAVLAELTLRHFEREQKIFSYNMGVRDWETPPPPPSGILDRLLAVRTVPAPAVERRPLIGRRLVFKPYKLPGGFDMRDHGARVREFGQAFVTSITGDVDDYRTAVRYVERRFGAGRGPAVRYPSGGMPTTGVGGEA